MRTRVLACAVAIAAIVAVQPAHATHSFHKYSVARETSAQGTYTGIRLTRNDITISHSAGTNCTVPYTGDPVYQTQWIIVTSDAQNWIELGTGHQCNGYRYRFWGYGYQGVWNSVGTSAISGTAAHTFRISRRLGNTWDWYVDSTLIRSLIWAVAGYREEMGLESYDGHAGVSSHTSRNLQRTTNQGSWVNWAGFDSWTIDGPEMCGGWNTASEWRAAENRSC